MANPAKGVSQLADASDNPMIGSQQALIADYTFTYTTDDPGLTAGDSITIADGDSVTVAELHETTFDLAAKINAILNVMEEHGLMADA